MQVFGRRYVCYIDRRYVRTGTLWEGRFRSSLISSDCNLLTCMRYIGLNPVRAFKSGAPRNYNWSAYQANAHHYHDGVTQKQPIYTWLSGSEDEQRKPCSEPFRKHIKNALIHQTRETLNNELVLGRPYARTKLKKRLTGKPGWIDPEDHVSSREVRNTLRLDGILETIAL